MHKQNQEGMAQVYLILGSNLGDRLSFFAKAKELLQASSGTITKQSSLYETEPWGFVHENSFLNQVILFETTLEPIQLLGEIKTIESMLGRKNGPERYNARCIDIDILFYDDLVLNSPELVIPHREMTKRRFVMEPLAEISPKQVHPLYKQDCENLLLLCEDICKVRRIEKQTNA